MEIQRAFTWFSLFLFIVMIFSGCIQNGGDKAVTTLAEQTTIEVTTTEATMVSITSTIPQMVGKPNGESCVVSADCSSLSCKDKVCCDKDQCGYLGKCYNNGNQVRDCVCVNGGLMLCGTTTIPEGDTHTTMIDESSTTLYVDVVDETTTTLPRRLDSSLSEEAVSYPTVEYAASVGDKLAYFAQLDEQQTGDWPKSVLVYNGKEYGSEYYTVLSPLDIMDASIESTPAVSIGGKLVYRALLKDVLPDGGHKEVIVYDGKEYGKEYSLAYNPRDVNGKLTYSAKLDASDYYGQEFIVYDGKEIGKEYSQAYDPVGVGGKLAYVALGDPNSDIPETFIVYDGKQLTEYTDVDSPFSLDGKLGYFYLKEGKSYTIYDGKHIGDKYFSAGNLMLVGGKLAYLAGQDFNNFVVLDGKEGKRYDLGDQIIQPDMMVSVNGKLAYFVGVPPSSVFEVFDGKEMSERYDEVIGPTAIGDELVFIGKKEDGYVLMHGNKAISLDYDEIVKNPANLNGKYTFIARRGDKYYIVREK